MTRPILAALLALALYALGIVTGIAWGATPLFDRMAWWRSGAAVPVPERYPDEGDDGVEPMVTFA